MPLLVKLLVKPTTAAPFSVNVPLIVTFEPKVSEAAALSEIAPPVLINTAPEKVLVPVALLIANIPLAPFPMVVVPVTPIVNPPTVKVVPSPIERLPPILRFAAVVADTVPLNVKLLLIAVTANVFAPEPESIRL